MFSFITQILDAVSVPFHYLDKWLALWLLAVVLLSAALVVFVCRTENAAGEWSFKVDKEGRFDEDVAGGKKKEEDGFRVKTVWIDPK